MGHQRVHHAAVNIEREAQENPSTTTAGLLVGFYISTDGTS